MTSSPATSSSNTAFSAQHLSCMRGERLLFKDLDIILAAGDMLQIFGANGSGKTTLLRILSGLLKPDAGNIAWQGHCIANHARAFAASLFYIGHTNGIKLDLSPLENLRFTSAMSMRPPKISLELALEKLGLSGFEEEPVRTLSAGQRRRAALARVLISDAKLWIFDELFTSLDKQSSALMQEIIQQHLLDDGIAILTSHHELDFKFRSVKKLWMQA